MNVVEEVKSRIYKFWAGIVESIQVDPLAHTVEIRLKMAYPSGATYHVIVFGGVASYFFVADEEQDRRKRIPPEEGDYTELSEIEYCPQGYSKYGFHESTDNKWVQSYGLRYYGIGNFTIEMWSMFLLIEADRITIDGEEFYVGYPV